MQALGVEPMDDRPAAGNGRNASGAGQYATDDGYVDEEIVDDDD